VNKQPMAWIVGGVALIVISILLTEDWSPAAGLIYNITNGELIIERIPLRWPVIAGIFSIFWGVYLRFRNSN